MFGINQLPKIVKAGHPVLREKAKPVDLDEINSPEIQELITIMIEVMRAAPGVGLAAPQIGVGLQVAVLEDREEYISRLTDEQKIDRERRPLPLIVLINPTLTIIKKGSDKKGPDAKKGSEKKGHGRKDQRDQKKDQKRGEKGAAFFEGCLSVPGYLAVVDRHLEVKVEGWNEKGERVQYQLRGWQARIAQHEVDHLNGMLFIDRMDSRTFSAY